MFPKERHKKIEQLRKTIKRIDKTNIPVIYDLGLNPIFIYEWLILEHNHIDIDQLIERAKQVLNNQIKEAKLQVKERRNILQQKEYPEDIKCHLISAFIYNAEHRQRFLSYPFLRLLERLINEEDVINIDTIKKVAKDLIEENNILPNKEDFPIEDLNSLTSIEDIFYEFGTRSGNTKAKKQILSIPKALDHIIGDKSLTGDELLREMAKMLDYA